MLDCVDTTSDIRLMIDSTTEYSSCLSSAKSYEGETAPCLGTLTLLTMAFQACFVSAGAVAARFGATAVAAHQVVLQLWSFLALVLDSFAIAAQSLVGAALGAGELAHAKSVAWRVTIFSTP